MHREIANHIRDQNAQLHMHYFVPPYQNPMYQYHPNNCVPPIVSHPPPPLYNYNNYQYPQINMMPYENNPPAVYSRPFPNPRLPPFPNLQRRPNVMCEPQGINPPNMEMNNAIDSIELGNSNNAIPSTVPPIVPPIVQLPIPPAAAAAVASTASSSAPTLVSVPSTPSSTVPATATSTPPLSPTEEETPAPRVSPSDPSYEIVKLFEDGCKEGEEIAEKNKHRPCFRNIQNLCVKTRNEITKPNTTTSNIHSQGIPWATKDFVYAFVRLANCWQILNGYLAKGTSLRKVEKEYTPSFKECYERWEKNSIELATELRKVFGNLDTNLSKSACRNEKRRQVEMEGGYDSDTDSNSTDTTFDSFVLYNDGKIYMKPGNYRVPMRNSTDDNSLCFYEFLETAVNVHRNINEDHKKIITEAMWKNAQKAVPRLISKMSLGTPRDLDVEKTTVESWLNSNNLHGPRNDSDDKKATCEDFNQPSTSFANDTKYNYAFENAGTSTPKSDEKDDDGENSDSGNNMSSKTNAAVKDSSSEAGSVLSLVEAEVCAFLYYFLI